MWEIVCFIGSRNFQSFFFFFMWLFPFLYHLFLELPLDFLTPLYSCILIHTSLGSLRGTLCNFLIPISPNPRMCVCVLTHLVVSDSLWPHGLWPAMFLCPWDSPDKNTGVGSNSLLQGIFLTQGLNRVSWIAGRFFTIWAEKQQRNNNRGGILQ